MKNVRKNWITTLLGSASLSAAVIQYINNPDDYKTPLGMILVGLLGIFSADAKRKKRMIDKETLKSLGIGAGLQLV